MLKSMRQSEHYLHLLSSWSSTRAKAKLHLGKNNPMHRYMLWVHQLGSSLKRFCIKRCVSLGGHCIEYESAAKSLQQRMSSTSWAALVQSAGWGKWSFLLFITWETESEVVHPVLVSSGQDRHWYTGSRSVEVARPRAGAQDAHGEAEIDGIVQP